MDLYHPYMKRFIGTRNNVAIMKIPWKYWGPFFIFILISVIVWIALRVMDFYFNVLIGACSIMLVIGIVLFIVALVPTIRWLKERSRPDQDKKKK